MKKRKQTRDDLIRHLKNSIGFLQSSAKAFDEGYTSEAQRMAITIRIVLYNTPNSISLLKHLDKDKIKFYDYSMHYSGEKVPTMNLIMLYLEPGQKKGQYIAPLDDIPLKLKGRANKIDFRSWWNQCIAIDRLGNCFSRKKMIIDVANKDGGAHVDAKINEDYAQLTRDFSMGWMTSKRGQESPISDFESHSIRQICFEVIKSLYDEFPSLFDSFYARPPLKGIQIAAIETKPRHS